MEATLVVTAKRSDPVEGLRGDISVYWERDEELIETMYSAAVPV
jgi:hypothetical protein